MASTTRSSGDWSGGRPSWWATLAHDFANEAFVKLFRNWSTVREPRAWLYVAVTITADRSADAQAAAEAARAKAEARAAAEHVPVPKDFVAMSISNAGQDNIFVLGRAAATALLAAPS